MSLESQFLFLFSALGAINGLFLSLYFAFFSKKKQLSNYYLSALLLVLSIRILKSVFLFFNPGLFSVFVHIGISACVLIGPFLYLYVSSFDRKIKTPWMWAHIIPALVIVIGLGIVFNYWSYKVLWSKYIVKTIYLQWLIYIVLSGITLKPVLKKAFSKRDKLRNSEVWMLSVFVGVAIIWFGYNIGSYTSYIVGALSFSFVLYLVILLWVFKKRDDQFFFEENIKYDNKKIKADEAALMESNLDTIIKEKELFKNPDLRLNDVASQLHILPHYLSQFLNDNLGKSFSLFINEYRIEEAKRLLIKERNYTTEAIGYECGFNSKSTFFTTFKKLTGSTPANYRKNIPE